MIYEKIDKDISCNKNKYTLLKSKEEYLLKQITIEKDQLQYAFIGGMWYTHEEFSFNDKISLPYPFSTYYTFKIIDKNYQNTRYRPLLYVKTPLLVIQLKKKCICVKFNPYIKHKGKDIFPFIGLYENDTSYIISFYLFSTYSIKTKKSEWLGRGKKETIQHSFKKNDSFKFSASVSYFDTWEKAVFDFFENKIDKQELIENPEVIFDHAKKALWRSYDDLTGSFLQLPWKTSTGFTFQNSSYSLLTYEAVRLNYFSKWYEKTKDRQFQIWKEKLRNHFTNQNLYTTPSKKGDGIIWYNMTNLTKKGLNGYFYMDCGYAGYPGGQASIAVYLLDYLTNNSDKELENIVKQSLTYLLSTQHADGSWPMAINQGGIIHFRKEKLSDYISYGGTGEAARALYQAYEMYHNKDYLKSAEKALAYLTTSYPISYNGLRDIGIMEPEAFSVVSIIYAFLDGYDLTNKNEYLQQAFTYATHLLTWIYMYDTSEWKMAYNFHPISYSITPRLSPYETAWIVTLFNRLSNYSKDPLWTQLAINCYNSVLPWISSTGGLSEGVFPHYQSTCKSLPMDQTFATVELMNASFPFIEKLKKDLKTLEKDNNNHVSFETQGNVLQILFDKKMICKIDAASCQITKIKDVELGSNGITLSIQGPYQIKNKIKHYLVKRIRGSIGKYLLGIKDATYAITGVKPPHRKEKQQIDLISNHINSATIECISNNKAIIKCTTPYHNITFTIQVTLEKKDIVIAINPFIIEVCDHDLTTNSVIYPLIDGKITHKTNTSIELDGCILKGAFQNIVHIDQCTGIDQTLETNWTHGGIFKSSLTIIIPST
jgi:lanthionine synthetase-like protein